MDDDEFDEQEEVEDARGRRRAEGVRIIGAEEAARALKEGQAAGKRPEDAPRFGDVPKRPSGPKPAQRFPLPGQVDPAAAVVRPPVAAQAPEMPHWTEPPTGEVPRIIDTDDEGEDLDAWSGLSGPRWRDQDSDWDDSAFADALGGEDTKVGALDDSRTDHSDLYEFDEPEPEPEPEPQRERAPAAGPASVTTSIRTRQAGAPPEAPAQPPGGRDLRGAVVIGAALAAVALLVFKAGPKPALVLVTAIVTLAAAEAYDVLRRAGYRPATLLGLIATVSLMFATYSDGVTAVPLVLVLTTMFAFLWYLFGVVRARPTVNVAITLFVFSWVGLLGSFAALLLALPDREGIAFLLGAVIATAAHDIGALFFGSQMGSRPLAPDISPNKTMEGLIGGMLSAVFASVLFVGVLPGIHPWTAGNALVLGLVVAVVAPLGDLCESMVKRDLGVKDMGSLLPGHGGVLDRFDALLFVLPATYYLVKLLDLA
ncbi:MAG TPA: phosphatidate cytidylyltransferase [Acidimicrobiales bacterium]|nr:phosphatidate cytidylyltransferase [Acidimicrobiales bacterium]